jgi:hypothetical protein
MCSFPGPARSAADSCLVRRAGERRRGGHVGGGRLRRLVWQTVSGWSGWRRGGRDKGLRRRYNGRQADCGRRRGWKCRGHRGRCGDNIRRGRTEGPDRDRRGSGQSLRCEDLAAFDFGDGAIVFAWPSARNRWGDVVERIRIELQRVRALVAGRTGAGELRHADGWAAGEREGSARGEGDSKLVGCRAHRFGVADYRQASQSDQDESAGRFAAVARSDRITAGTCRVVLPCPAA